MTNFVNIANNKIFNRMTVKKIFIFLFLTTLSLSVRSQFINGEADAKKFVLSDEIPGGKLDHKGIIINPTPRSIILKEGKLDIRHGIDFRANRNNSKYLTDLERLNIPLSKSGVKLEIKYGDKITKNSKVEPKPGAYILTINNKGISIDGYDDAGVYYGLQTLKQLLSSEESKKGYLPYIDITDYPELNYRGVVEGFYGNPWRHEVRLSIIDFLGQNKMNSYVYGPKDDPYHRSPYWRLPYPEKEEKEIKELIERSKINRVNFVWAIHPGQDIRWNQEDYDSLLNKFNKMYDLGVRSFAIFFDDIDGKGTDSHMQAELLNNISNDFVNIKGDVSNLIVCPTDYSQLWANPAPNGQLSIYGENLNPSTEVFWTGEVVCSNLTPETLEFVNQRIKRPALFWWNFPVTDYAKNFILQGPVYGLDITLTKDNLTGIESNPMEHGEASKLAIYGVGDYAWNPSSYNPIDNWERGIIELVPEASEAYRLFAIHNGDTQTGYRRNESWETTTFAIDNYTEEQYLNLKDEFNKMILVPQEMESVNNKGLLNELRPWLIEFGKLGERGYKALELLKVYENRKDSDFWSEYLNNLMTKEDYEAYNAHKTGTLRLQPFYEDIMKNMVDGFYGAIKEDGFYVPDNMIINNDINNLIDLDPSTSYCIEDDSLIIDLPEDISKVLILANSLKKGSYYSLLDANSKEINRVEASNYNVIGISSEMKYIKISGPIEVYDIFLK